MKLYNNPDAGCSSKTCCSIRDVEDARSVAVRLGMPYFVFNYMDEFRRDVMETFAGQEKTIPYKLPEPHDVRPDGHVPAEPLP